MGRLFTHLGGITACKVDATYISRQAAIDSIDLIVSDDEKIAGVNSSVRNLRFEGRNFAPNAGDQSIRFGVVSAGVG